MRNALILLACSLMAALPLKATNVEYASALIKSAAQKAGLAEANLSASSAKTYNINGTMVTMRTDELGVVEHVGVPLFAEQLRKVKPSPVYDYVEFALLNHILRFDEKFLNNGDVTFKTGSWNRLRQPIDNATFSISNNYGKYYKLIWKSNGKAVIDMEIQILYDHLGRSTMQEMEARFLRRVKAHKVHQEAPAKVADLTKSGIRGVWQTVGGTFQVKSVSNSLYYNRKNQLLCDSHYPELTLTNLLLSTSSTLPEKQIRLRNNYSDQTVSIGLRQLMQFATEHGMTLFAGIKSKPGSKTLGATLYAVDRSMGYFHMFMVECDAATITTPGTTINAHSQLYVPIDAQ